MTLVTKGLTSSARLAMMKVQGQKTTEENEMKNQKPTPTEQLALATLDLLLEYVKVQRQLNQIRIERILQDSPTLR